MPKIVRFSAFALLLVSPALPGATFAQGQAQPRLDYQAPPATATPPANQTPPAVAAPVVPVPPPAPVAVAWERRAAEELLEYVEQIGKEGLDPASYQPERLRQAISGRDRAALGSTASEIFLRLTSDLSGGYVRGDDRVDWHMPDSSIDGNRQQTLLAQASQGGVAALLDALLPTHPQYLGLRQVLAGTPESDEARRQLIRANMERWRWMPRELGPRHVIVNVPAFTAAIVDEGRVTTRHRVVVGARRTPTPQLMSNVVAVTMNPWWNVPQSIIREMGGRFSGYQVQRNGGAVSVRQPPGPRNALGRLKIEMPNEYAIYLHDTPAQALFERPVRAFSHGCIRTQHVRDFAAQLLAPTGQWDRAMIDQTIATGETTRAEMATPIPVYIAYFTAAATTDGTIVTYADIYGRDAPVREALNRAAPGGQRTEVTLAD